MSFPYITDVVNKLTHTATSSSKNKTKAYRNFQSIGAMLHRNFNKTATSECEKTTSEVSPQIQVSKYINNAGTSKEAVREKDEFPKKSSSLICDESIIDYVGKVEEQESGEVLHKFDQIWKGHGDVLEREKEIQEEKLTFIDLQNFDGENYDSNYDNLEDNDVYSDHEALMEAIDPLILYSENMQCNYVENKAISQLMHDAQLTSSRGRAKLENLSTEITERYHGSYVENFGKENQFQDPHNNPSWSTKDFISTESTVEPLLFLGRSDHPRQTKVAGASSACTVDPRDIFKKSQTLGDNNRSHGGLISSLKRGCDMQSEPIQQLVSAPPCFSELARPYKEGGVKKRPKKIKSGARLEIGEGKIHKERKPKKPSIKIKQEKAQKNTMCRARTKKEEGILDIDALYEVSIENENIQQKDCAVTTGQTNSKWLLLMVHHLYKKKSLKKLTNQLMTDYISYQNRLIEISLESRLAADEETRVELFFDEKRKWLERRL